MIFVRQKHVCVDNVLVDNEIIFCREFYAFYWTLCSTKHVLSVGLCFVQHFAGATTKCFVEQFCCRQVVEHSVQQKAYFVDKTFAFVDRIMIFCPTKHIGRQRNFFAGFFAGKEMLFAGHLVQQSIFCRRIYALLNFLQV